MTDLGFQWGGPLGALNDAAVSMQLHPMCFGSASLEILNAAAFAQMSAQYGGDQGFVEAVKRSIVASLAGVVAMRLASSPMTTVMRATADLIAGVEARENAMLQVAGASLRITDLRISLNEDEHAALQQQAVAAAMAARAAKMRGG